MTGGFRWEEPPRIRRAATDAWMEQLHANPDRWARVLENANMGTVIKWRTAYPDIEFVMRNLGRGDRTETQGDLYARYVPRRPADKPPCVAPGCDRPAIARGMCMMHYKRVRAGKPLDIDRDGHPAGFGQYGVLDVDDDSVLCHECGWRFPGLGAHIRAHGLTAREYKQKYGLPLTKPLNSRRTTELLSERARERLDTAGWRRFEAARDPVTASLSRTEESFAAIGRATGRSDRPIENGRRARKYQVVSCPICAAEWCPLPGGYRNLTCSHDCWRTLNRLIREAAPKQNAPRDRRLAEKWLSGHTLTDLADQYGITTERIGQIIRRHLRDNDPDQTS